MKPTRGWMPLEIMEKRVLFSQINVADFGAVPGDGRSDTAAIQAAIDASRPGDVVRFPAGAYDAAEIKLRSSRSYVGESGAVLRFDSETGARIEADGRDIEITGLRFEGAGILMGDGRQFANIRIVNNEFIDIRRHAIKMTVASDRVTVENNLLQNIGAYGALNAYNVNRLSYSHNRIVDVTHGGHVLGPLDDVRFVGNHMTGVRVMGLEIQRNSTGDSVSRNLLVEGNVIHDWKRPNGGSFGLSVIAEGGLNTRIVNNYVRANIAEGSNWNEDLRGQGRNFGLGIEAGFDTGVVEGNVIGGPFGAYVTASGINMPVNHNRFFGKPGDGPKGYIRGWPSIRGTGTFVEEGNVRNESFDAMPGAPRIDAGPTGRPLAAPPPAAPPAAPPDGAIHGPQPPSASSSASPHRAFDWVSDLQWTSAHNGWGPVEIDMSNGERDAGDGAPIQIRGRLYERGLGVAVNSEIVYELHGRYAHFFSHVGVDDYANGAGSMSFAVFADGNKVFDSGVLTGTSPGQAIELDVRGVSELRLVTTDAGDGGRFDHGNWAGAKLTLGDFPRRG